MGDRRIKIPRTEADPSSAPGERGFSLLELLVVVSIAGLLFAFATPVVSRGLGSIEIRAAARDLASALRTAETQAVVEGETKVLLLDVDARSYRLGKNGDAVRLRGDPELTLVTAAGERVADNLGGIRFFPDGSSTGGHIELRNRSATYRIAVEWITGKVYIIEADKP